VRPPWCGLRKRRTLDLCGIPAAQKPKHRFFHPADQARYWTTDRCPRSAIKKSPFFRASESA
jgi:hypothetical protein